MTGGSHTEGLILEVFNKIYKVMQNYKINRAILYRNSLYYKSGKERNFLN